MLNEQLAITITQMKPQGVARKWSQHCSPQATHKATGDIMTRTYSSRDAIEHGPELESALGSVLLVPPFAASCKL